jgi:predicted transcriptional regulator
MIVKRDSFIVACGVKIRRQQIIMSMFICQYYRVVISMVCMVSMPSSSLSCFLLPSLLSVTKRYRFRRGVQITLAWSEPWFARIVEIFKFKIVSFSKSTATSIYISNLEMVVFKNPFGVDFLTGDGQILRSASLHSNFIGTPCVCPSTNEPEPR